MLNRWRQRRFDLRMRSIAAVALFFLLGAVSAYSAHIHKNAPLSTNHPECALCVHFDRIGGAPEIPAVVAIAPTHTELEVLSAPQLPAAPLVARYQSRAPPIR
jgi:hypothetical protein